MWKISFTLLILLNSVIGGMLFWQWNAYSESKSIAKAEEIESATQEISVKSKGNAIAVTQLITGLKSDKEYRISMPDTISDWECVKADGAPCDSVDENPTSFLADHHSLTIRYNIELNHTPFLLNSWTAALLDVEMKKTSIEVIDSSRRDGTWVAGLPLKGHNKLEFIDYYYFEGNGTSASLYWQSQSMNHVKGGQGIYLYSEENMEENSFSFDSLKRLPDFKGLSVVYTEAFTETNGNGLMITKPSIKKELLERKIIYNYFLDKSRDLPLEERWLIDVLTSLMTGQESNVQKGNEFLAELKKQLSEEELSKFLDLVFMESSLTPERLDELLGSLAGKSTHFFALNKNEETKLIPLYYTDKRKIMIQNKLYKDHEVLLIEDKKYYPFVETLEALGFEVKLLADNETILLNKENNSYRFFINQNIFIYNEEDYGLLENPLNRINGKVYVEGNWLNTIFKIHLEETEKEIKLSIDY